MVHPFHSRLFYSLPMSSIFLTYDDGPNPSVTPPLLDLLDDLHATATFFVTGESLKTSASREILRSILARGHTLGNHGLVHRRGTCPRFDIMRDEINDICGVDTRLIRAPYGSRRLLIRHLKENLDCVAIHWTTHFTDWQPVDLDGIGLRLPQLIGPGIIVLLHDGYVTGVSYKDRMQVLRLTQSICQFGEAKGIEFKGIAAHFPQYHQLK